MYAYGEGILKLIFYLQFKKIYKKRYQLNEKEFTF